ncbi:hypothetical protein LCGC14_2727950, partial [marine sediment metagenome]
MEVIVTFEKGKMNSDVDQAILPKGEHIESENMDFFSGATVPMRGMSMLTDQGYTNATSLGRLVVPSENLIYNLYKADGVQGLYEYDTSTDTSKDILKSVTGKLNLSAKVPKMNLIGDFIFFTGDGVNPPRRVDRTIVYGTDGFDEKDIQVIQPAPLKAPVLALSDDGSGKNNIKDKFLGFATRYKYIGGEYSAFSPFSPLAFLPESFDYNYATHTNNGMVNNYNTVEITFNTGNDLVEEIEVLFKETGSNAVYVIDSFNKEELGYSDDSD